MSTKPSWEFERGQELEHDTYVVCPLGGGRSCEVWLLTQNGEPVIGKFLRPSVSGNLERERKLLDYLDHKCIVKRRGELEEYEALLLGYVPGPTLKQRGSAGPEHFLDLAKALRHMHRHKLVHLDVKPSNVIINGRGVLIDLSIARTFKAARKLTSVVGTTNFRPPEQEEVANVGPWSDVWSLGAIMKYGGLEHSIVKKCMRGVPEKRPTIDEVVRVLKKL